MRQGLLLVGVGGLVGGVVGARVAVWLGSTGAESIVEPRVHEASPGSYDPAVLRRLESVEHALRVLQTGNGARARAPGPAAAAPEPEAPVAPVGDPVFEAAVLDVLERAEEDRDSERVERRSERERQRVEHWGQELAEHLELSPQQAARLLSIRSQLTADLREQRAAAEGRFVPRDERRAAVAALRERAEQQLRAELDARQAAKYDQLDGKLKLVRPPDLD